MRVIPPNSIVSATFSQNIADMRARATSAAQESITGQHADLTKHLGGRIGDAMTSHKALSDIANQRGLLSIRAGRLDLAQQSLGGIQERISGLEVRMLSALSLGDQPGQDIVARDAEAALRDTFNALNSRHGDRFLFAGDQTATQPLTSADQLLADILQIANTAASAADFELQLDEYFQSPTGGWLTSIYAGSATSSDPDAVTATDPAIIEVISGLAVMAISTMANNVTLFNENPDIVAASAERIGTGSTALVNLRADIGISQERIAKSRESLDTEEAILNTVFNSMVGRDQYDAASELKQLEAGLEAAYLLTSRLSNLNLLNFLR